MHKQILHRKTKRQLFISFTTKEQVNDKLVMKSYCLIQEVLARCFCSTW